MQGRFFLKEARPGRGVFTRTRTAPDTAPERSGAGGPGTGALWGGARTVPVWYPIPCLRHAERRYPSGCPTGMTLLFILFYLFLQSADIFTRIGQCGVKRIYE
jgi:hypothetical protein